MRSRRLGPFTVSAIGFGCMNLSHAYGRPPAPADAARRLCEALDAGYTMLDTAALYGFGANESLIGETLAHRRSEYTLATKCGIFRNASGVREIDGSPVTLRRTVEASLQRLRTDTVDLCYLHRWDRRIAIEESVGAISDLVREGKVRTIGLSEVSAETLRRAHAVHPISAVQSEYSLWTRNPEIAVLAECRRIGASFVAFSPLARGFLADGPADPSRFEAKDIRRQLPRFEAANALANRPLYDAHRAIAHDAGCSPAQLALAWLLAKGEDILPIPGTTQSAHLRENALASDIELSAPIRARLDALLSQTPVAGARYNATTQAEIDTETFASEA